MLFGSLLVLVGNYEVVYHAFDRGLLLVEVLLVLLDALLAAKEDEAITKVLVLALTHGHVLVAGGVGVSRAHLRVRPL